MLCKPLHSLLRLSLWFASQVLDLAMNIPLFQPAHQNSTKHIHLGPGPFLLVQDSALCNVCTQEGIDLRLRGSTYIGFPKEYRFFLLIYFGNESGDRLGVSLGGQVPPRPMAQPTGGRGVIRQYA